MAKWEEQSRSQAKVPGAPDPSKTEAGIVDPDALAHTRIDIAGAEPDTAEAQAESAKRKPRHADIGGLVSDDRARDPRSRTIKCVVTAGGLMVRKSNGGYENLPTGSTFDVSEDELPGYLAAGTIALASG